VTSTGDNTRLDGHGGGSRRPRPTEEPAVVRHEEDVAVAKQWHEVERLGVRRVVDHERVSDDYPREREELAYERVPVADNDSGEIETLADGSISIPLYEEELEVVTRTVLRERVIIRKERVTEWQTVEAERRRERVELELRDADPTDEPPAA
jgi:uncharacterized protein (TIGR02271 family)